MFGNIFVIYYYYVCLLMYTLYNQDEASIIFYSKLTL